MFQLCPGRRWTVIKVTPALHWRSKALIALFCSCAAISTGLNGCQRASAADAPVAGLVLELHASRGVYRVGDPIEIAYRIENTSRTRYYTVFPQLRPEGLTSANSPESELVLVVTDGDGRRVPYVGFRDLFTVPPSAGSGLVLVPGAFFGQRVRIEDGLFAYDIKQPGVYTIAAEFRHRAKSWVRDWLQAEARSESSLPYEVDRVFDGVIRSSPIEIELKSRDCD